MVEEIEELRSELNPHPFANVCSLEDRKVEIVDPRPTKNGIDARLRSGTEVGRCGETTGVKPLTEMATTRFSVAFPADGSLSQAGEDGRS